MFKDEKTQRYQKMKIKIKEKNTNLSKTKNKKARQGINDKSLFKLTFHDAHTYIFYQHLLEKILTAPTLGISSSLLSMVC